MKRLNAAVLATLISSSAYADFQPITSENITTTEMNTPGFTENIAGDSIWLCLDTLNGPLVDGDVFTYTLSNDARFASATMSLEESKGGAGTGSVSFAAQTPADATGQQTVTFTVNNAASISTNNFNTPTGPGSCDGVILSGQTIAGQAVDFSFTNPWASTQVTLNATLQRGATTLTTGSVLLFNLPQPPRQIPSIPLAGLVLLGGLLGAVGLRKAKQPKR